MGAQHHPSIAIRTIAVVLLLWLVLAVLAWNQADTRPKVPAKPAAPSVSKTIVVNPVIETAKPQQPNDDLPKDLLSAVRSGHAKAILQLVNDNKQVQLADALGDTPLHYAARQLQPVLAQLLLVYGADPLQPNNAGLIPVQLSREGSRQSYRYSAEQRDMLDVFIDNQRLRQNLRQDLRQDLRKNVATLAQVQAVFNYAALRGEFGAAEAALNMGANPAVTLGRSQRTLLHLNQSAERVASYLALGSLINARDKADRTALSLAIASGNQPLAQTLLQAGARISATDSYTDLGIAVSAGKTNRAALTALLLEHGAIAGQNEWLRAIASRDSNVVSRLMRHSGGFDPASSDGAQRISAAQKHTGDRMLEAMRRDTRIDAYVQAQIAANKTERAQAIANTASWLAPHMLWLALIITLLACLSLVPISLVNRGMRWNVPIGGLSAAAFVHLFLFNQSVELALAQFRFFGEPVPAFRTGLMIIGDGIAFAIGAAVGVAWSMLPKRNPGLTQSQHFWANLWVNFWANFWANKGPRLASVALYLACLGTLIGHNTGSIHWPSKAYRTVSGYDAYTERQTQAAQVAKQARIAKNAKQKSNQPPSNALFNAIKANDNDALKDALTAAIASQIDINTQDRKGNTAIHKAMYPPRPLLVQTLIDAGAAVDVTTDRGQQPLHLLVAQNFSAKSLPVLELLLSSGANPNATDTDNMTPLCLALRAMKPRLGYATAKLLLAAGADINPEPNCAPAALAQDPDLLRYIVQQGAKLDALQFNRSLKDSRGTYQGSALWSAAYQGDLARCQLLITMGANIEQRDTQFGRTPLQAALSSRHSGKPNGKAIASLFIAAGAQTTAFAWDGRSTGDFDTHQQLPTLLATAHP